MPNKEVSYIFSRIIFSYDNILKILKNDLYIKLATYTLISDGRWSTLTTNSMVNSYWKTFSERKQDTSNRISFLNIRCILFMIYNLPTLKLITVEGLLLNSFLGNFSIFIYYQSLLNKNIILFNRSGNPLFITVFIFLFFKFFIIFLYSLKSGMKKNKSTRLYVFPYFYFYFYFSFIII